MKESLAEIPQPPETFLLGNLLALSATTPVQDMVRLAREYGPIYRLEMRGRELIVVSGYELVNDWWMCGRLTESSRVERQIIAFQESL